MTLVSENSPDSGSSSLAPLNTDPLTWIGGPSGDFSNPSNWSPNRIPDAGNSVTIDQYGITEIILPEGTVSMAMLSIPQGRVSFTGPSSVVHIVGNLDIAGGEPATCTGGSQTLSSLTIGAGSTVTFTSGSSSSSSSSCVPSTQNPLPTVRVPEGMDFSFSDLEGSIDLGPNVAFSIGNEFKLNHGARLRNKGSILATSMVIDGGTIYSSVDQIANFPISVLAGGATISVKENTTFSHLGMLSQVSGSVINQLDKGTVLLMGP